MNKDDIIRKLTSRKFWLALCEFVTMLILYCGGSQDDATRTVALIMAGAGLIAYIIGEGLADAAGACTLIDAEPYEKPPENGNGEAV